MKRLLLPLSIALLLSACTGSLEKPKPLPGDVLSKLTGKANIFTVTGWELFFTIYNGSEWNITDIDVLLEKKQSKEQRKFRLQVMDTEVKKDDKSLVFSRTQKPTAIKPLSEGVIEAEIGDFLKGSDGDGEWKWSIVAGRGFK